MNTDRIVAILHPFDAKQSILVYKNDSKINSITVPIENVPAYVVKFSKEYDIENVGVIGPKKFSLKIIDNIKEEELYKYSNNSLKIELLR